MKRFFDIIFSLLILALFIPFFILTALIVKFDSKGPVIFSQNRIGLNGRKFKLYKLRTMYLKSDEGSKLTIGSKDNRITPAGYYLRKFKIDEIPQFINVLKGDMSIVGPRPEVEEYVKYYSKEQLNVLSIKPGITDYASIAFINENELLSGKDDPKKYYIEKIMPEKIEINMNYLKNRNGLSDFKVILHTFFSLFRQFKLKHSK